MQTDADDVGLFGLDHLAVIIKLPGLGPSCCGLAKVVVVDITDGDHGAMASCIVGVALSLAAHADAGKVNRLKGRLAFLRLNSTGNPVADASRRRGL